MGSILDWSQLSKTIIWASHIQNSRLCWTGNKTKCPLEYPDTSCFKAKKEPTNYTTYFK